MSRRIDYPVRSATMRHEPPREPPSRQYDVIVVLGAAVWSRGRPSPTLARRLRRGLELFRGGWAGHLLFTGGLGRYPPAEAELMRSIALSEGVDPDCIVVEAGSRNTLENAMHSARLMRERGWTSALLVSDPVHLPRARLAFWSVGIRARGRGVGGPQHRGPFKRWWQYAIYETVAFGWYLGLILAGRHRVRKDP